MLDKKLFKALRAGGLGHAAAALLADQDGRYGLGQASGLTTDYGYATLQIGMQAAGTGTARILQEVYPKPWESGVEVYGGVVPLFAGAKIWCYHSAWDGHAVLPDGDLFFSATKVADANGIPVDITSSASYGATVSRSGGTFGALPAVSNGWTASVNSSAWLVFAQATAGHYLVSANFWKA